MQVILLRRIRYGQTVFEAGEIGTIVNVEHPLTFEGSSIYDYYVSFHNHPPIGLFQNEVKEVK